MYSLFGVSSTRMVGILGWRSCLIYSQLIFYCDIAALRYLSVQYEGYTRLRSCIIYQLPM